MKTIALLLVLWPGARDWQIHAVAENLEQCRAYQAQAARFYDHTMVWNQPELRCEEVKR